MAKKTKQSRNSTVNALEDLGKNILSQIKKGKNPEIAIPIRALSNIEFDEKSESDSVIEDLELITDHSREQLNINANKNGSVAGKVIIEDKGDTIDWSKLGSGGWSIPSNVEEIKFKKVTAQYVLYMEKA